MKNYLKGKTPILETTNSFLPVRTGKVKIPEAVLCSGNNREDATVYFSKNGIQIALHAIELETNTVSCSGRQCDRQRISTVNKGNSTCGCAFTERGPAMVIDGSLELYVPAEFVPQEDTIGEAGIKNTHTLGDADHDCTVKMVDNFRSWRFTNSIIKNADQLDPSRVSRSDLRKNCKSVVTYVNENGGWDIVGWYKMGTSADASDNDRLANRNVSNVTRFHISLLRPTNLTLVRSDEYKSHQYNQSNVDTAQAGQNGGGNNGGEAEV